MKDRLLELLVCPACRLPFSLSKSVTRDGEVEEGLLLSECGRSYPIIRGIPRILPKGLIANTEFRPAESIGDNVHTSRSELERTSQSFGFQWTKFKKIDEGDKATFLAKTLWTPDSFSGKLVLDAGCGFGRYSYFAAQFGAEVIAIDLSVAVDSARANTAHLSNIHLVQGDLMDLPFRSESFDMIYSIGVLHHTADPAAAFTSVSSVLRPDGELSVWVYEKGDAAHEVVNSFLRAITTHLPRLVLWKISGFAANHAEAACLQLVREHIIFGSSRVGNFDWYSPQYQHHLTEHSVHSWFNSNGFDTLTFISPPARGYGSSFGARGTKATSRTTPTSMHIDRASTSLDKLVDSDSKREYPAKGRQIMRNRRGRHS